MTALSPTRNGPIKTSSRQAESEPHSDDEPRFGTLPQDQATEPWYSRFRLIVFNDEQKIVGWLLLACLIGMPAYFLIDRFQNRGLIEIDAPPKLTAEFKIDLNQAEFGEIVVLPGVGKSLANAIIEHRQIHGSFESFEAIADVPGIGPKKLEKLIPYLLPMPHD